MTSDTIENEDVKTIVALSQATNLEMIGCVGVEIQRKEHKVKMLMAREWHRDVLYSEIANGMKEMFAKKKWDYTFADYIIGDQLIKQINQHVPIEYLTVKSKLVDTKDIEYMQSMDMAENSKYIRQLKNANDTIWPTKLTQTIKEAMRQLPFFIEHITAAGTPSYYSEEKEYDHLTKAWMIAILGGRKFLEGGDSMSFGGPIYSNNDFSSNDSLREADIESIFTDLFPNSANY